MLKSWKFLLIFVLAAAIVFPTMTNVVHADDYGGYSNIGGTSNITGSDSDDEEKDEDEESDKSNVRKAVDDKREKDKEEASEEEQEKKQGGIVLDSTRYPDENYMPIVDEGKSWWIFSSENVAKMINAVSTVFFSITKQLSGVVDSALDKFMGMDVIDQVQDKITDGSEQLWTMLKSHFMPILMVIAAVQIFTYYVAERNGYKAWQATLRLTLVIGIAIVWLSNSGYYLNVLNHVSSQAEGYIMEAGTALTSDVEEVNEGEEIDGATALLRNNYFYMTVKRPYLIMNYGTTDEDKIEEKADEGEDRIDKMLSFKVDEEGNEERQQLAKEEVDYQDNKFMSQSSVPSKFGIAFLSMGYTLLIGIPLFILAFFKILVQFAVLMIAYVLPITFLISILPMFANSAWKSLGRLIGVFFIKMFISLLMVFTFIIFDVVDTLLPPTSVGSYYLNMTVSAVLMIFMLMKRNTIVELITAGRVMSATNVGGSMKNGMRNTRNITRKTANTAKNAASHTATKGLALTTAGVSTAALLRRGASKGGNMLKNRKNSRGKGSSGTSGGNDNKQPQDQSKGNVVDFNARRHQRKEQENQQKPNSQEQVASKEAQPQEQQPKEETGDNNGTPQQKINAAPSQEFSNRRKNRTPQDDNPQTSGKERPPKRLTQWEADKQAENKRQKEVSSPTAENANNLQQERNQKREERRQKRQENIQRKNTYLDKASKGMNNKRKQMAEQRKRRRR